MATALTGLLGKAALTAATWTVIYTTTAGKTATVNIRAVNRDNANGTTIRLAICPAGYVAGAAPAAADYIEPIDLALVASAVLEDSAMPMSGGESVVAYSGSSTVTVRVSGFEA